MNQIISIPYGVEKTTIELPASNILAVADQKPVQPLKDPLSEISKALKCPVYLPPLRSIVRKESEVLIVVNDLTRATPTYLLLQPLISELNTKGIPPDRIKIMVATGLHEIRFDRDVEKIVGKDICYHYNVACHNPEENLIRLGTSRYGTR